ncbi:twin-arginine translocation signal domain-containing protein [Kitasatospora sp. NPDC048365]|uniref:twin-arginine translocation signal domain-containing protein n=1 Tax=Kitasatospora sp. NPDC048365 TaxID=3364050 RepID=UPI0037181578
MHEPQPRRISRRSVLRGAAVAGAGAAVSPLFSVTPAHAAEITSGSYTIRYDNGARQTILGLGFEIQSDSIGSGNNGLPNTVSGVPYDLTDSERTRFYQQMLKAGRTDRGFRYCRLALGLYHRGLDATNKHIVDRYPGQSALLAGMIQQAGIEGVAAEYWSPAPGWKSTNSYIKGTLASFAPADLDALGDAMVGDLDYLVAAGVPISMWGLQNEPKFSPDYSGCTYDATQYLTAFKAVAPKIRAKYPNVMIHANSLDGWSGDRGQAIKADPQALSYVDAWTYHRIGTDSNEQITTDYTSGAAGKPVFNNEFEYLDNKTSDVRTLNTAQSIMNWMTFQNSPTWFWLHALKPTTNAESPGYSLGFWRPPSDTDFSHFPNIPVGHWDFNPQNWNAVAGFVKYMPWDSVRHHVEEPVHTDGSPYTEHRIMAWKTPSGKQVFALTNRSTTTAFTYTVDTQTAAPFQGHRYGPATNNLTLPTKSGPTLTLTVPPLSIEFWVRTP